MGFSDEIKARLVAQGMTASTIFVSSKAKPPATGDYVLLTETGGIGPYRTHNDVSPSFVRPNMQVIAGSETAAAARALIKAAYDALMGVRNMTLSGTRYLLIDALQEPFDLGPDANTRIRFAFNINTEKEPS